VSASVCLSGCATIFTGGGQENLTFKSVPEAATLTVVDRNGVNVHNGTTPATIKLNRGAGYFKPQSYKVTVSKPGYQPRTIDIRSTMSGWYFANVVIGGALGMLIIDPLTGAMYRLTPNTVSTSLEAATADATDKHALTILLAQDVPLALWKDAERIQ
jgi:hypothetical protein